MGLVLYNTPPAINFSRNPIRFKVGTDIALTTTGLYIEALIEFKKISENTWTEVIKYPLTPDSQGIVEIDLSRIANTLLEFDPPSPQTMTAKDAAKQTGFIRVTFTEFDSVNNQEGGDNAELDEILIIKGGIAHERYQNNTWFTNRYPDFKFLTWMPAIREQLPWVNDYISYLHLGANAANAEAIIDVTFTDNTTDQITIPLPGGARQNHVYHIPCGYANCNIAELDTSKKVWKYTVQVFDGNTPLSEQAQYIMRYDAQYETFHLSYFNSLGGFESIPLTGDHTLTVQRDFDMVNITTNRSSFNSTIVPAMSRMNRVTEQQIFRGNIGVVNGWTIHDLRRELFLSPEIYTRKNNRWWPVNVLDKSSDFGPFNAQIKEVQIEWAYAFSNTQYTPELAALGDPPSFAVSTYCPNPVYAMNHNLITISFHHAPSPVDEYEIQLLNTSLVQVGNSVFKRIPYASPITHTFTGLTPDTGYRLKIIMRDTESGLQRECLYSTVTTPEEELENPDTPGVFTYEVKLGYSDFSGLCSLPLTTVYSHDSILTAGSVLYSNPAATNVIDPAYQWVVIYDGSIWSLLNSALFTKTTNTC